MTIMEQVQVRLHPNEGTTAAEIAGALTMGQVQRALKSLKQMDKARCGRWRETTVWFLGGDGLPDEAQRFLWTLGGGDSPKPFTPSGDTLALLVQMGLIEKGPEGWQLWGWTPAVPDAPRPLWSGS
jgi:hypothetical protein